MRKYILLIIALCLHIAARGQTIEGIDLSGLPQPTKAKALRYWFDDDASTAQTTTQLKGSQTLDVSALAEGLHTLHYQVVDDGNVAASVSSAIFMKMNFKIADMQTKKLRYWFDDDGANAKTLSAAGVHTLDAQALSDGLHTLHYQIIDADGQAYHVASGLFLKTALAKGGETIVASKLMYWFDDETTIRQVNVADGSQLLDASKLTDGLHTLHYQIKCSNGDMTTVSTALFLRTDGNAESTTAKQLRYWFDEETKATVANIAQGAQLIDVQGLTEGLHTIHYQLIDDKGMLSPTSTALFMQMSPWDGVGAQKLCYWFDDDKSTMTTVNVSKGVLTLDVANLQIGLHTLNYQTIDSKGRIFTPVSRLFVKTYEKVIEGKENHISEYVYWLNEKTQDKQTVKVSNASNPYTLISLIPMQKEPIRSQFFHFELTDGQPTVYAKNEFHIRFHDAAGYFADNSKPFVDYIVKQEVEAELLKSGSTATVDKPAENVIKWYKLDAEPGDSLQFMLDRTATLQLFSPSGEEVFTASGSDVVTWCGCHVMENGTFYLALHDVTATYGNTVSISYNHIDKYAVLRQDVSVVGNGGCSTITFEGNGFRDLYAVELTDDNGNTIEHLHIGHESDATTSVVFDFTNAILGKYNAVFHFTEGDKTFDKLITVEKAKDIELATTVTYPSTFLRGTSTTYTVKITNKGNMTAYGVPIYTYIKSKTEDGIFNIRLKGLYLPSFAEVVDTENLSDDDKIAINEYSKIIGDDWYFIRTKVEDEDNPGDSIVVRTNYFFTQIAPNSTKTIELSLSSNEEIVTAYFTVPDDWMNLSSSSQSFSRLSKGILEASNNTSGYCCVKEGVECFADMAAFRLDVASVVLSAISIVQPELAPIAGTISWIDCGVSIANGYLKALGDWACNADEEVTKDKLKERIINIVQSTLSMSLSCISAKLGALSKSVKDAASIGSIATGGAAAFTGNVKVGEIMKSIAKNMIRLNPIGTIIETIGCAKKFTKKEPGCPPSPPGGGPSAPVKSIDPNDIYGYTAESGSKAIKDELTDVNYRIEFENDPEIATAAAHNIYVTNTLDATKFDLSTFKPTRIKIGEKSAELSGDKNFVTTIDMRPAINAIAQVEGTYDQTKGIASWHISSLDPMTMEPTKYVMDGVLPVNSNGNGIGEVMYDISLKPGLVHGTKIDNRASIVFDTNEAILTPTWTNVIDRVKPESHVSNVAMATDTTAAVSIAATDELSGPWRYDVYVQYGEGSAWFLAAENVPADTVAYVKVYEGIDHGFYTVVTDSAGNVEQKEAAREFTLEVFGSQVDTNTRIDLAQGWNWASHNQQEPLALEAVKPKAQRIVGQTEELYKDSRLGWMGDLAELLPTQMYKLQMAEAAQVQLSGRLFNAGFRSIPLYQGWNWIGYPVAKVMTPTEALAKLEADEGDMLIGQDGLATYSDGQWTGTLSELRPGSGYMYRSAQDKNLFLNATAQASSRKAGQPTSVDGGNTPSGWTVDKHRYPNVMGVIATLTQEGHEAEADEWLVAAFSGGECRGVAQTVGGVLMMNVYGTGTEQIAFYAMNRRTEEVLMAEEKEDFRADVIGTMQQPYQLHVGQVTGIVDSERPAWSGESTYDLQGRRVDESQAGKGVYIVTDEKNVRTQKRVRR